MSSISTLFKIWNHPPNRGNKIAATWRYLRTKWSSKVAHTSFVFPYIEKSRLQANSSHQGASMHYVFGLHEFEDMMFLLHFLRSDDLFVDVGANIGAFSVLAANEVGAKTVAFEPHPETFNELVINQQLNEISDDILRVHRIGLADKEGSLGFSDDLGINNHVNTNPENPKSIQIPVKRFDQLIKLDRTTAVKIDVEGFETSVIAGMGGMLMDNNLQVLVIETQGLGDRFGFHEPVLHTQIIQAGFIPVEYNVSSRLINEVAPGTHNNTIFVRDKDFVQERLQTSRKWTINGREF